MTTLRNRTGGMPSPVPYYYRLWFVILTLFVFWPAGLFLLFMMSQRHPEQRRWIPGILMGWIGPMLLLGMLIAFTPLGKAIGVSSAPTPAKQVTPKPVEPTKPDQPTAATQAPTPKEPEVPFSQLEVTAKNVERVALLTNVSDVQIDDFGEGKIISIHWEVKDYWNDTDLVKTAARRATVAFERLFENPRVSKVKIWADTQFRDAYGKEKTDTAVEVTWSRATADQVGWKNFKESVVLDYKRLFPISDAYDIHLGVYKNLPVQDKQGLPPMK